MRVPKYVIGIKLMRHVDRECHYLIFSPTFAYVTRMLLCWVATRYLLLFFTTTRYFGYLTVGHNKLRSVCSNMGDSEYPDLTGIPRPWDLMEFRNVYTSREFWETGSTDV